LDIEYCNIVAPVTGRVGLRQVDVGNYVQTSDTNGIVVITQLSPISALFTVPEDQLPQIAQRMNSGARLSASAYDRANTVQLAVGALQTYDNQVDTSTGTVRLRALFENDDHALFPNQFVNVRLLVDTVRDTPIVPSSAVQTGSVGTFVYLVKPDNTVTVRKVKTGAVDGERTAVTQGVDAGDTVVIDGTDRLREGSRISAPGAVGAAGASGAGAAAWASGAHAHGHRPRHAASAASAT
ncbi:MAG: efflux RND transporter periplasmic adaptor subunit, partial [Janthinobacterium lividum]